jgi:hypothetical protein
MRMFLRRHKKMDWPLFVILLFGSIVLLVAGVYALASFVMVREHADELKTTVEDAVLATTPAAIRETYVSSIEGLRLYVEEGHTVEDMFARAEEVFLSVRVPSDLRDSHLSALLRIEQLKENEVSEDAVRTQILDILGEM